MPDTSPQPENLRTTPLHDLHVELGARLVPFAGWEMPIQFEGVVAEHNQVRNSAGLFDVAHMAVVELWGDNPALALESVTPAGYTTLAEGKQRYGLFTNDNGGVIDDFMGINWGDHFTLVVNAARAEVDIAHLTRTLGPLGIDVIPKPGVSLIALQGPEAASVIIGMDQSLEDTIFLDARMASVGGIRLRRSEPDTPERMVSSSLWPQNMPMLWPGCCWRTRGSSPPASAPATLSVSRLACASTATISTRLSRRWKPTSNGRSPSDVVKKPTFPAPNVFSRNGKPDQAASELA